MTGLKLGSEPWGLVGGMGGEGENTSPARAGTSLTGVGVAETERSRVVPSRYLIPCNHMMLSQRWAVKERDCYSVSAAKLLALTPVCCSSGITLTLGSQERDYILWSKCTHASSGKRNRLVSDLEMKGCWMPFPLGIRVSLGRQGIMSCVPFLL